MMKKKFRLSKFMGQRRLLSSQRMDFLRDRLQVHRWGFALLLVLALLVVLMPHFIYEPISYELGREYEGAPVYPPRGFVYQDAASVAEERQRLLSEYPLFYRRDEAVTRQVLDQAQTSMDQLSEKRPAGVAIGDYERVIDQSNPERLRAVVMDQARRLLETGIVAEAPPEDRSLALGGLSSPRPQERFYTMEEIARIDLSDEAERGLRPFERRFVESLLAENIQPNLILDQEQNQKVRDLVAARVPPILKPLDPSQPVILPGEEITPEMAAILSQLNTHLQRRPLLAGVGLFFFLGIIVGLGAFYLHLYEPDVFKSLRKLILIGALLFLVTVVAYAVVEMGPQNRFSLPVPATRLFIELHLTPEAVPVAAFSMLLAILMGPQLAVVMTVMMVMVLAAAVVPGDHLGIFYLISGFVGAYSVRQCRRRSDVFRSGLYVGLFNLLMVLILNILSRDAMMELEDQILSALFSGVILAPVIVLGALPVLENLFHFTTDFRLLELADLNHPLMRRLLLNAPGTYQHSLMVSNLAEFAAEGIGANSLLCRVGSYYHDIGKLRKTEYFVENNLSGSELHSKLKPSLSASILKSHVKEGVNLAREYGLPQEIIDFIPQHQGTAVMGYFYHQALEQAGGAPVDKKEFQYPGPKPQMVETAIVMLADSVEAACRSIQSPTSSKIEKTVRKIINNKFAEGELDECDLTLRGLNIIAERFIYVLSGLYHTRIEYPDQKKTQELEKKTAAVGAGAPTPKIIPEAAREPLPEKKEDEDSDEDMDQKSERPSGSA